MINVNRLKSLCLSALVGIVLCFAANGAHSDEKTFREELLKPGTVVIMRHALAPGTGDPDNFEVDDCGTQRNLSESGRRQSKEIGARLLATGVGTFDVYSSQWCRCLETARLLGLGPVKEQPFLNSFFQNFDRREDQTKALRNWLKSRNTGQPAVLVTHQVNITALTDIFPRSGEMLLLRLNASGDATVVARLTTPAR